MLTKEQLLAAIDHKTEDVDVPELGGTIRFRTMSGRDRDQYGDLVRDKQAEGGSYFNAALIVSTAINEDGSKLFTRDDIDALRNMNGALIGRLADATARLNGFTAPAKSAAAPAQPEAT